MAGPTRVVVELDFRCSPEPHKKLFGFVRPHLQAGSERITLALARSAIGASVKGKPGPGDLWGKTRDSEAWHPLVAHSTDVACMLRELVSRPGLRRRLARAGGVSDLDDAQLDRLAHLAFLHDLGKCSAGFRAKAVPELGRPCGHLAALRPLLGEGPLAEDAARILDWPELARWCGEATDPMLLAVLAHHGQTPDLLYARGRDEGLRDGWLAMHREPLARLEELVQAGRAAFPMAFATDVPALPASPAFQHLFAGLLMLADWLASDDRPDRFPYAEIGDPPRHEFARRRAHEVLTAIGFEPAADRRDFSTFAEQFGQAPRPAQAVVDALPLPAESGSLVLIESETGSGKTEAALRWASRLVEAGRVDGCFFAVPLRSAAVQIHGRIQAWLDRSWDGRVEALLAVPGYFRVGAAAGARTPDFRVQWSDDEVRDRSAERWAAEQPKRYAAAAFAVGTIDQALLGALQVKHAHLRAACLVRHLLVIDEVHASDAYMTALTARLIDLFRACGGHVLLMSATLGAVSRARWFGEARPGPLAAAAQIPYPLVSASHLDRAITPASASRAKRVVAEPVAAMSDAGRVARIAAEAALAGARVVVLRNTVRAAVQTQRALETQLGETSPALFRAAGVVALHHGRYAAEDRRLLDAAVETALGRESPTDPVVVVATQTLEQSLDVDADLLITDLCPIDVLLQRIGRLHRHERRRPAGFEMARCVVLMPPDGDLSSRLHHAADGIGPDRAYANVLAVEAARRAVEKAVTWTIPADNRRLVEAGTHPDALREIAQGLGGLWLRHERELRGIAIQQGAVARDGAIAFTEPFPATWTDSAERLATRLGAADLLLPLDREIRSPFGARLTHLKIPAWMAPKGLDLRSVEPLRITVGDAGELTLQTRRYRYDRFGLCTVSGAT